jgi:hypothetical protein
MCDDCHALIEDTEPFVLVPNIPLISNFTDLGIPPHCDPQESLS